MKKKSDKNDIDSHLDFDDLDDLEKSGSIDFDDDDLDTSSRKTSVRDTAKELGKEAGKGFFDSLARKTAEKALPDSYQNNYYSAMDYADFAKDAFQENKSRVNRSIYKLGSEVKKILPFQSKMLDRFLSKYEADFEEFKQQNIDQQRDASIASNINSIFDKQLEIQKAIESKNSAENEVNKKQKLAVDKINLDVLTSIDSHVGTHTAFTLQVNKEYYRKSLELQYKSYFIQADMLKDMRDYYKGFSLQLEDIAKNTSLPDFVKLNNSERVQEIIRTQFFQNTYKQLFSNSEYVKGIKEKMAGVIRDKVSSVTDKIDNVTEILSGVNQAGEFGGGSGKIVGGVLAGMGGGVLGEKLSKVMSPKLKEKIKGNRIINTGGNLLDMLASSPRTFFTHLLNKTNKASEEYSDESTPLRYMFSKLLGGTKDILSVTDPGIKEHKVTGSSILDHDRPAIFDNKVHRSITEVIPMYLARILSENTNLRQMYKTVNSESLSKFKEQEELFYNYNDRKLSTKTEFKLSTEKAVLGSLSKNNTKLESVANSINSLAINSSQKSGNKKDLAILKNKNAKKEFSKFMIFAADKVKTEDFNYDKVVSNYSKNPDLSEFVKNNKVLGEYLAVLQNSNLSKNNSNLNEMVLDSRRVYPTLGVIELFKGASKISGSKVINNINADIANRIAEGLTRYISTNNSVITMDNIISGQCFKMMTTESIDICLNKIKIFVAQCKSINDENDYLKETSFGVLLGLMNESLINNFNINPEVFQKLHSYSPVLQESGPLGLRNMIEGKLGKDNVEDDLVDVSTLKIISKSKVKGINKLSLQESQTNIVDKIQKSEFYKGVMNYSNIGKEFTSNISKAENAKDIVNHTKKMFGDIITQSRQDGVKIYRIAEKEFAEGFSKLNTAIENVTEKNAPVVKSSMLTVVRKLQNRLDDLISKEEGAINLIQTQLDDVVKTINDNIDDNNSSSNISKELNRSLKIKELEIKSLKKFRNSLKSTSDKISNIDTSGINVGNLLKSAYVSLRELKKEAEETLSSFEKETEAQIG